MLIDLVQLRTFVAVAEEQHLTRAAERLHISQSAASAHVRTVEEVLGTQLFVRTNRSLELTRAGQLLLEKAKALLNEAVLFASFAREIHGKTEGHLIVGAGSESASSRIGEIVGVLRQRHPLISVDLYARPSSGARQGLKTGELDVGLLLGRPLDPGFCYYEIARIAFRVAGPVAWQAQIERAGWAELAGMPWISPADAAMAYSPVLERVFGERGLELNTVARFDNATLGRAMLQAGVGLMLMREEHVSHGLQDGTLAVSPLVHCELQLLIAHRESRRNDPLIQAFMDSASQVWPRMQALQPHATH
ncbi:LysR family transcriptional regulator [Pigmentiphaga sp. NML080357]|uniref:LysR family transcriptional regulator n=1 Tax=Pigmentiphaga sp. NML080357 TaxID=2008675 RepID=UPI000B4192BE|nr:LysR family transcriptional regulator [Pigmentiphaga sp. NML080357]OVZ59339.1 LysR family transcriptional regulator [Pigmentiphaga sp. NML080357]